MSTKQDKERNQSAGSFESDKRLRSELARWQGQTTKDEEEGETEGERLISGPPSCAWSRCRTELQLESFSQDEMIFMGLQNLGIFILKVAF